MGLKTGCLSGAENVVSDRLLVIVKFRGWKQEIRIADATVLWRLQDVKERVSRKFNDCLHLNFYVSSVNGDHPLSTSLGQLCNANCWQHRHILVEFSLHGLLGGGGADKKTMGKRDQSEESFSEMEESSEEHEKSISSELS